MPSVVRYLKWVGDPILAKQDGWGVPNWKYENRRVIALQGFTSRGINKSDDPRLSRSYFWDKDLPGFVLEVEAGDAAVILEIAGEEFRDVTREIDPTVVQNRVVVLPVA
ncbi:MAG: hypothetical protein M3P94_06915 [Chloroflexota bacterium]|nr:hypothetical protein [Chloroflexota bacterium]